MNRIGTLLILLLAMATAGLAQELKMPVDLEKLAAKASETTEVTLDSHMLQLAAKFMNDEEDDREARDLVKKLKGIYVRSFEFDSAGEYSEADIESLRSQLTNLSLLTFGLFAAADSQLPHVAAKLPLLTGAASLTPYSKARVYTKLK